MASFAKDVTTQIDIPTVQSPDFTQNRSTLGDVVDIVGFGLGIQQRNEAKSQEADRQGLLNTANSIASTAEDMLLQPGGNVTKSLTLAKQRIRDLGLDPTRAAQLQVIVAKRLGFQTIGQAVISEEAKFENSLDSEFNGLKEFGDIAKAELAPGATWSEQSTDRKELIVERGLRLAEQARVNENNADRSEQAIRQGNFGVAQEAFKFSREMSDQISGTLLTVYQEALNKAQKQGLTLGIPELQSMRESMVSIQEGLKQKLNDSFSEDRLLVFNEKDSKRLRISRDSAMARFDKKIEYYNNLEDEAFKNFADVASLMKNQEQINIQEVAPELSAFKALHGSAAMNTLVQQFISGNAGFRNALKSVVMDSTKNLGITQSDNFAAGMAIVASIGEGKGLLDYDAEDNNKAANIYWETTKVFVDNPSMIESSTNQGITKMAIAAVQVLEFAEERGTDDDKQRAIKTLNSPGFKALYDKSAPEVKAALGRKVLQYNRDTIVNTAKRVVLEPTGGGQPVYNSNKGQFEIIDNRPEDTRSTEEKEAAARRGTIGTGFSDAQFRQQENRVKELNKQLSIIDIYAKDDPFLASLNSKQRKDFFIRTAGLPATLIEGTLATFTAQDEQAQAQGVTVQDLRDIAEQGTDLENQAEFFSDIERQVQQSSLTPELQQKVKDRVSSMISGEADKDFEDLDDEEFAQLVADEKARRASK